MSKALEVIKGEIERFAGNGRKLGYPTANLAVDTKLKDGVYFGTATMKGYDSQPALIFLGTPTTLGDTTRRVEAYLLDIPDIDYYGLKLEIDVLYFHRSNKTFNSVDELLVVMKDDEVAGREWFKNHMAGAK